MDPTQTMAPIDYIFDEHGRPFPCEGARAREFFAVWGHLNVGHDVIDGIIVSTFFIGLDQRRSHDPPGPPLIWETWVAQDRARGGSVIEHAPTSTYSDALQTHRRIVEQLFAGTYSPSGRIWVSAARTTRTLAG